MIWELRMHLWGSGGRIFSSQIPMVRKRSGFAGMQIFAEEMVMVSEVIKARAFDSIGLTRAMPFIWRCLGLRRIPYLLAI